MNRTWIITGYDTTEITFAAEAVMSDARVKDALRLLAGRHLSEREIVEATQNGSTSTLLEVRLDRGGLANGYSCGEDRHYTAVPKAKGR